MIIWLLESAMEDFIKIEDSCSESFVHATVKMRLNLGHAAIDDGLYKIVGFTNLVAMT